MEVIRAINKVSDTKAAEQVFEKLVPALWPQFQRSLEEIPDNEQSGKNRRPQHEILEELVTGIRGLNSRMRDFDPDTSEKERYSRRRKIRFHPRIFEEMAFISSELDDGATSLVLLAGIVREDFPWLAELLLEAYREIKDGGPEEIEKIVHRLPRTIHRIMHSSFMREFAGSSKEAMIIGDELPMILDMTLHRLIERRSSRKSSDPSGQEE